MKRTPCSDILDIPSSTRVHPFHPVIIAESPRRPEDIVTQDIVQGKAQVESHVVHTQIEVLRSIECRHLLLRGRVRHILLLEIVVLPCEVLIWDRNKVGAVDGVDGAARTLGERRSVLRLACVASMLEGARNRRAHRRGWEPIGESRVVREAVVGSIRHTQGHARWIGRLCCRYARFLRRGRECKR